MREARGIYLAEDEVIIREYEASYIDTPKSEGYIVATNRRLIFTGSTSSTMGSSIIVRDTKIDNITGVVGGLTRKKSILQIIFGVIIALVGIVPLIEYLHIVPLLIVLLGGYIAYRGISAGGEQMYLSVFSSQASPTINVAVEASRGLFARITSHDALMTVSASGPGKHTEQMIREIGALVQDIQIMGELAVEKWIDKPMSSESYSQSNKSEQLTSTIATLKKTATTVKATAVTATDSVLEASKKAREAKDTQIPTKQCECKALLPLAAEFCTNCGKKQVTEENIFG